MVDFNSEGTMSKPPKEVVALIIIEKLYNFLEADETHTKTRLNGASAGNSTCRARLRNLFLITYKMLERRLKPEEFQEVCCVCMGTHPKIEDAAIIKTYFTILGVLDDLQLTKLDTRPVFKRHMVEDANQQHGY